MQSLTLRRSASRPLRRTVLAAGLALAAALHADEKAPPAPAAAKTHALFMGADISVTVDNKPYPVRDVDGKYFVVFVGGKERMVTSQQVALQLMVAPSLKLASTSAMITDFHHDLGYSPGNDPAGALNRAMNQAALLNASNYAALHDAQGAEEEAVLRAVQTGGASAAAGRGLVASNPAYGGNVSTAVSPYAQDRAVQDAQAEILVAAESAGADSETSGDKGFSKGFDALDISFGVASPKPLTHPFLVTITEFHTKGEKPGLVRRQIHAREIGLIDAHANQIAFQETGFPAGFTVKSFEIHLYDHGQEVATNVAPNYVALTADEAFEYIKMEYLAAHKQDTLKAVAVLGDLPPDFALHMAQGKYPSIYYVRVSKDGLPFEIYGDEAGRERVSDPFIISVIQKVRFKPALQSGKAVDSIAVVNLAQIQG